MIEDNYKNDNNKISDLPYMVFVKSIIFTAFCIDIAARYTPHLGRATH